MTQFTQLLFDSVKTSDSDTAEEIRDRFKAIFKEYGVTRNSIPEGAELTDNLGTIVNAVATAIFAHHKGEALEA